MNILDKFMAYINEYAYGEIGNYPARKLLLTGKVEVFNAGVWIKATKAGAKEFIEAAPAEEPGPPPPLSDTPRVKKRNKVNAAEFDNGSDVPPATEEAPKINIAQVRARAEAEQQRIMEQARQGIVPTPPKTKGKGKKSKVKPAPAPAPPAYAGDPEFFLSQMEELSARLDQVQFSSASGYRELQEIRSQMRDCIAAFRGDEPPPFEEQ